MTGKWCQIEDWDRSIMDYRLQGVYFMLPIQFLKGSMTFFILCLCTMANGDCWTLVRNRVRAKLWKILGFYVFAFICHESCLHLYWSKWNVFSWLRAPSWKRWFRLDLTEILLCWWLAVEDSLVVNWAFAPTTELVNKPNILNILFVDLYICADKRARTLLFSWWIHGNVYILNGLGF